MVGRESYYNGEGVCITFVNQFEYNNEGAMLKGIISRVDDCLEGR